MKSIGEIGKAMGDHIAAECEAEFGTTWSVEQRLKIAFAAMRYLNEQGIADWEIRGLVDGNLRCCDGYCHE